MFRKFSKVMSVCFTSTLIIISIFVIGIRFLGFKPYAVLTGSMEPELKVGSLIYVKECESIKIGDYVTFYINDKTNVVTHQIVDSENNTYITKGIANETADINPLEKSNIIGKVYFCIPYIGYITSWITGVNSLYIFIGFIIICFSISLYSQLIKNK